MSGSTTNYILTANVTGDGFIQAILPVGKVLDVARAGNITGASSPNILVDQTAPEMLTSVPRTTLTNASSVTFDITFSEQVNGFSGASLIKAGSVTCDQLVLAGSGSNYTVTVPGLSGDGFFALQFSSNTITDSVGNIVTDFLISSPVTLDNTKPIIQLIGASEVTLLPGEAWTAPGATISDSNPSVQGLVTGGDVVNPFVPGSYIITYNTNDGAGNVADQITRLVTVQTQYEAWTSARGLDFSNNSLSADANGDGKINLSHFAFDTDPLGNGSSEGKTVLTVLPDGGSYEYLTLTLPMRKGLTFSGSPLTAEADGLRYILHADDNLTGAELSVIPRITQTDVSSLPSLSGFDGILGPDYEYLSFRLTDPIEGSESAFLWVEVRLLD